MKICRFNHSRLGLIEAGQVYDITEAITLDAQWPLPEGDMAIHQLVSILPEIKDRLSDFPAQPLSEVRLDCPVANPGKVIGAPVNYREHIEEANAASEINTGKVYTSIDKYGLFIKASSSLIGPSDQVQLHFPERRSDHEVELAVIIGQEAYQVEVEKGLDYVFGYSIGLDMTIRGAEFPGFRKSVHSYGVLGPWIVTPEEIGDPNKLDLSIMVNGELRQKSNTSYLLTNIAELISYASSFYKLYPGDVIMTGTPAGVSQVMPGDVMEADIENIGKMRIDVAKDWVTPSVPESVSRG